MKCAIFYLLGFSIVYKLVQSCTTTSSQYKSVGEDVVLSFQATVGQSYLVTNVLVSPDGTEIFKTVYRNGAHIISTNCPGGTFVGDTATGDMSVRIDNIAASQRGTYRLTVDRVDNQCITVFILGLPRKPTISANRHPSVGESVTLMCTSSSSTLPSNHGLSLIYSWKVDNTEPTDTRYSYVSSDKSTLTISNVKKEDANRLFTCSAQENVNNGYYSTHSSPFSPDVFYGPENLAFNPLDTIYEKQEGNSLAPVTCSADCNPSCSFSWAKVNQGTILSNTAQLDLEELSVSDTGTYRCTATRSLNGSRTKDLTLNVIHGPTNMSFVPPTTTYRENEGVSFQPVTCSSQCWECTYTWTGPNSYTANTAVLNPGRLTTTMHGDYICTARNKHTSRQINKQLTIEVTYSPRPHYTIKENITSQLHVPVTLSFTAMAYPVPVKSQYTWRKYDGFVWRTLSNNSVTQISVQVLQTNLTITNMTEGDYGQYQLVVTNNVGTYTQNYNLIPQRKPENPLEFKVVDCFTRSTSAIFEWTAGFNGGLDQRFVLRYKRLTGDTWTTIKVKDNNGQIQNYTLRGLSGDTKYQAILFAENDVGKSEDKYLAFQTEENCYAQAAKHSSSSEVIGGSLGALVVILSLYGAVITFLYINIRRSINKGPPEPKGVSSKDSRSYANMAFGSDVIRSDLETTDNTVNQYSSLDERSRDDRSMYDVIQQQ